MSGVFVFREPVENPGLQGSGALFFTQYFFKSPHAMDDQRLFNLLRNGDAEPECAELKFPGRSGHFVESGFADGECFGAGGLFVQPLFSGTEVRIFQKPGMQTHGLPPCRGRFFLPEIHAFDLDKGRRQGRVVGVEVEEGHLFAG